MRRDFGRKPIWLTEFGYQTNPPDYFGVKPTTQAQYVGEAALRAYQLPGVTMLIQFLVRDEPHLDRFQSGLFNVHGVAKPAYSAFRFPLAQVTRRGSRTSLWGQVRPGTGRALVPSAGRHVERRLALARRGTAHECAGIFAQTVSARPGTLVRIWSPQQHTYGWPLLVR